jgi:hypothetical protein
MSGKPLGMTLTIQAFPSASLCVLPPQLMRIAAKSPSVVVVLSAIVVVLLLAAAEGGFTDATGAVGRFTAATGFVAGGTAAGVGAGTGFIVVAATGVGTAASSPLTTDSTTTTLGPYKSIPYRYVKAIEFETAGPLDRDAEICLHTTISDLISNGIPHAVYLTRTKQSILASSHRHRFRRRRRQPGRRASTSCASVHPCCGTCRNNRCRLDPESSPPMCSPTDDRFAGHAPKDHALVQEGGVVKAKPMPAGRNRPRSVSVHIIIVVRM